MSLVVVGGRGTVKIPRRRKNKGMRNKRGSKLAKIREQQKKKQKLLKTKKENQFEKNFRDF